MKTVVKVWHLDWDLVDRRNNEGIYKLITGFARSDDGSIAVAHELINLGKYVHVADVMVDHYSDAFESTNTIHVPWWDNVEVTAYKTETRSTSVGDIIELEDGTMKLVRGVGYWCMGKRR